MDKFEEVPVVIGGPPCQDFSVQNSKRTWDSAKNQLVFKFIEVVEKVKAKVFLILMFYKKLKLPNTES